MVNTENKKHGLDSCAINDADVMLQLRYSMLCVTHAYVGGDACLLLCVIGVCGYPKFCSDSDIKYPNRPKI